MTCALSAGVQQLCVERHTGGTPWRLHHGALYKLVQVSQLVDAACSKALSYQPFSGAKAAPTRGCYMNPPGVHRMRTIRRLS